MGEKVMALTFAWWEVFLIAAFIVARLLMYLIVPSVLVVLAVHIVTKRFCRQ